MILKNKGLSVCEKKKKTKKKKKNNLYILLNSSMEFVFVTLAEFHEIGIHCKSLQQGTGAILSLPTETSHNQLNLTSILVLDFGALRFQLNNSKSI
jgi:hypothetical protein